jgi:hypothetical protein
MRFYDIGESPLMGHSEKHIAPLVLGGIIAAGASLAGNAIGASSQSSTNDANVEINRQNNQFNADQAAMQRQWTTDMWNRNNRYNSPNEMISRGLNPFISNTGAGVSKAPASGGSAASASPPPSLQSFRPDFSDVGSALASMAQARAAMLNAEQNAALTPYKIDQIRGATDYRNIGIGESGYWNASTGRRSALLDQSKEYQELKNMEFAGRILFIIKTGIEYEKKADYESLRDAYVLRSQYPEISDCMFALPQNGQEIDVLQAVSSETVQLLDQLRYRSATFCRDMIKHKKLNDANNIFNRMV